ncbi:MAG: TolC family protein [Planctomycetota bacterium]
MGWHATILTKSKPGRARPDRNNKARKTLARACVLAAALALSVGGLAGAAGCGFDADLPADTESADFPPTVAPEIADRPAPTAPAAKPTPATPTAPAPATPATPAAPLKLSVHAAVIDALTRNPAFQIDRYTPAISRQAEEIQRAAFDPTLVASLNVGDTRDVPNNGQTGDSTSNGRSASASTGIRETLPTGTQLKADLGADYSDSSSSSSSRARDLTWDATVTQSLLKGFGTDANFAALREAKLDTRISEFELRAAAETLASQVEQGYWNTVLAERSIAIYQASVAVADQQVDEVNEQIKVGKVAESQRPAAAAEAASQRELLIDARNSYAKSKLSLLRLLNAAGEGVVGGGSGSPGALPPIDWDRPLQFLDPPESQLLTLAPIANHVAVALKQRADLNEARLELRRGELALVQTRDGLLPELDLFITLGGSRYADAFSTNSPSAIGRSNNYAAGVNFSYLLGNRLALAQNRQAELTQAQNRQALANMQSLVEVDVRSAYVDVQSAAETITATAATRALRDQTLQVETEMFKVGKATTFDVAQAQSDLVASQIAEVQAIVGYREALINLYQLEGSLLQRIGIQPTEAPDAPVNPAPAP